MLVGESPGPVEARAGRPFIGPSGRFLRKMLHQRGFHPNDLYFTNAVKCYTYKKNRGAIKFCKPWLLSEIETLKPGVIIALGSFAIQALTGRGKVITSRGKRQEIASFPVIPTFHPAHVLRHPSAKRFLLLDLAQAHRVVNGGGLDLAKMKYTIGPSYHYPLEKAEAISFDIETNAREWWRRGSKIVSITFSHQGGQAHTYSWNKGNLPVIKRILKSRGKKIAQNGKFDCTWLLNNGVKVNNWCFDTMLAEQLLDENRGQYGLKDMVSEYAPEFTGYEEVLLGPYGGIKNIANVPENVLAAYAGIDADVERRIYCIQREKLLADERLTKLYVNLTMPLQKLLIDIEMRGIQVDTKRLAGLEMEKVKEIDKIARTTKINLSSHKQLAAYLQAQISLDAEIERTPKGQISTKQEALLGLIQCEPRLKRFIRRLYQFRGAQKDLTSFLVPLRKFLDANNVTHPEYLPERSREGKGAGPVTGRLNAIRPAIQTFPKKLRSVFKARPGHVFIEGDYSQVEFIRMIYWAQDEELIRTIESGGDVHVETALEVGLARKKVSEKARFIAKTVNYGVIYDISAWGLKRELDKAYFDGIDVGASLSDCERYLDGFFSQHPAIRRWQNIRKSAVVRGEHYFSPIGRPRRLVYYGDRKQKSEVLRQGINSPVQGYCSDLCCLAAIELGRRGIPIVVLIHDGILMEVPKEKVNKRLLAEIKDIMENVDLSPFGAKLDMPLRVKLKTGKRWGELK